MSIKLNDAQRVLLNRASQREDRCAVAPAGAKRRQALRAADQLIEVGFLKEIRAKPNTPVWRRDDKSGLSYSLKLTAAGTKTIAVEDSPPWNSASKDRPTTAEPQDPRDAPISNAAPAVETNIAREEPSRAVVRGGTKIAGVIALLERSDGATLDDLIAATGWLPHTTRAALTGLRKRGYAVALDRSAKERASVYRIVSPGTVDGNLITAAEPASDADPHSLDDNRANGPDRKRARRAA